MSDKPILFATLPDGRTRELHSTPGSVELYVDGVFGAMMHGRVVKINMFSRPFDFDKQEGVERLEVVARVVMDMDVFLATVDALKEMSDRIKEAGTSIETGGQSAKH